MKIIKVYGPYIRKEDQRKIVVLRLADGKLTTKTYARFLYERANGEIDSELNLTVDHIDEDVTNDDLENLQLLTRAENIEKSAVAEMYVGICQVCDQEFTKSMRYVRGNWKKGKAGPFCSRRCAGRFNAAFQYGMS